MDAQQLIQYTTIDNNNNNSKFSLLKNVLRKTGNAIVDKPYHSDFSTEQSRLDSFREWPTHLKQQPDDLVKAGFYYYGIRDMVKCFFCNGGLSDWDPNDVPIEEHARWYPKCSYLRQLMGISFLEEMREKFKNVDSGFHGDFSLEMTQYYTLKSEESHDITPSVLPRLPRTSSPHTIQKRDLSPTVVLARLDLPSIRKVIDLGFKKTTVQRAIENKLRKDGDDFKNLVDLVTVCYAIDERDKRLENRIKNTFDLALFHVSRFVHQLDVYNFFSHKIHVKPKMIRLVFLKLFPSI